MENRFYEVEAVIQPDGWKRDSNDSIIYYQEFDFGKTFDRDEVIRVLIEIDRDNTTNGEANQQFHRIINYSPWYANKIRLYADVFNTIPIPIVFKLILKDKSKISKSEDSYKPKSLERILLVDFSRALDTYDFSEKEHNLMMELLEEFGSFKRVKEHILELERMKNGYHQKGKSLFKL